MPPGGTRVVRHRPVLRSRHQRRLAEDDPAVSVPHHDRSPAGWRSRFLAGLRPLGPWSETQSDDGLPLVSPRWRWHLFVGVHAVTLSYRRSRPAGGGELDDRPVLQVARDVDMVTYWSDLGEWVDLRVDPLPDTLG